MSKVVDKKLSETTFAVLDLETSGGSPRLGAVAEIVDRGNVLIRLHNPARELGQLFL